MIALGLGSARPLHVLAIGAHADDIEIGAGGLLLSLLEEGRVATLDWVVVSANGEREAEARVSAIGLVRQRSDLRIAVTDFAERFLPHLPEVKTYVDDLGRRLRPDLVLAPRLEDRHQDHRVIAELVWQAFRDHLILEYEIAKYEGDLGSPNLYVPLESEIADAKVDHLLRAFPSQAQRPWFDASAFRALLRLRGVESNAASGFAEAFTARKVVLRAAPGQ